jgi:putative membrane protein
MLAAHTQRHALIALVAMSAVIGCRTNRAGAANRDNVPDTTATARADSASPDHNNGEWSDTKIVRVAMTANTLDSMGGAFALQLATSPAVKDFAQTMIRDHGGANKQAKSLMQRAHIPDSMHTGSDDPAQKMIQDATDHQTELRKLSGVEFDKAYIDREIDMHQNVLDALDDDLIPHAQNAELKAFLGQIRPVVASHLERAKSLKDQLSKGPTPASR